MAEFESWLQYREFSQYIMNTASLDFHGTYAA
jgi:hypothetical protein